PSNVAVDTLAERLLKARVPATSASGGVGVGAGAAKAARVAAKEGGRSLRMVRVGHPARVLPEDLDDLQRRLAKKAGAVGAVGRGESEVVLCTLAGAGGSSVGHFTRAFASGRFGPAAAGGLAARAPFDLVVIDEAAQIQEWSSAEFYNSQLVADPSVASHTLLQLRPGSKGAGAGSAGAKLAGSAASTATAAEEMKAAEAELLEADLLEEELLEAFPPLLFVDTDGAAGCEEGRKDPGGGGGGGGAASLSSPWLTCVRFSQSWG
ncbi:hypothetical protein T492DRAFT_854103, partial [Pavlovales sp. CCMP2436]